MPVILDTDIAPDYDDVGAMAVLHSLADQNLLDIKGVISCNSFDLTGPTIQIINEYFKRPKIPIGVPKGMALNMGSPYKWSEYLVSKYPFRKQNYRDAIKLYRQLLSSADDKSITIITIGFLTNLAQLLESPADQISPLTGKELVLRKVNKLVVMGGKFPEGREYNIYKDATSAHTVVNQWPTSIYFSGWELGNPILTGFELVHDYAIKNSPIKDVYAIGIHQSEIDKHGRMSWDQVTVVAAVDKYEEYFELVQGTFVLDEKTGYNKWRDSTNGNHYYFKLKKSVNEITDLITKLMHR
ncbi:nucleoside hydrolase [Sphingobacterium sp. SGG-5]|uniref:nucleoside hydrolase n=1 Tax=Sphingobacterium sp. SGG-5 TaxID=2710881 RepID=UPI0013EE2BB9|nr:nucleoside hydrolase [Sphingobacterium sp. SGG-5]NGM62380.1 nucleoside hydrolase [Sphingobacterium sp. SGG-5]